MEQKIIINLKKIRNNFMKKFFSFLGIAAFISLNAQQISLSEINRFNKFMDKVSGNNDKELAYKDISGSAFYYPNFLAATYNDGEEWISIRYNTYTDEIEYSNGADVYILPKSEPFTKFVFKQSHEVLVLENYDEGLGYFFELEKGKNTLLTKIKTKFKPEVVATTTLTSSIPPKFETSKPVYYIKTAENKIVKIPKNAKEFVDIFPNKKDEINTFIDKNKVKLNQEDSLKKLVKFLNQ